ncbi:pyridine nucleotide-disulfide oxidoreductase domain-containing protein 1 [Eurytemora carolleeae]|uniref:pyridine nucleotide-disulfide oxidoreductase domain-containing protein 1 n=1 Tax=Eurytemora carolleeae TaxID=1294199 RepID=UPI000C764CA8|nr:pyridine nucleotide-disulfide oxidoreductase domain-containing protein 1 [Eurytemora carolleeae]XP_023341665.1 pyridine nucleotide-disulfide oxidoreductase domain-containing protein 1 [Eurytemora carolleeae]|eukprot:XP_023341664.1 pyridine nucleotide-disulfide oxidoreductase domain-containing protein 1-like [Eurytemora affinis]
MSEKLKTDYLVVGGGIAGVSCTEMLYTLNPDANITLVTATAIVKSVSNVNQITKLITEFQIEETSGEEWRRKHTGISVVYGKVIKIVPQTKTVILESGVEIEYRKVCLCAGGSPKLISEHPNVLGIRDTASVLLLQEKLASAKRLIVVGNGGIATELVYELEDIDIVWAIKDDAISSVFLDPGASQFLLKEVEKEHEDEGASKRLKYTIDSSHSITQNTLGSALGPDWHKGFSKKGQHTKKKIDIKYNVKVVKIYSREDYLSLKSGSTESEDILEESGVYVEFSDGSIVGADFVISATGVVPSGSIYRDILDLHSDGGIIVDDNMQSSCKDVYAAGDVCHAGWEWSKHWLQMRLWTQARQMGMYAAKCMYYHTIEEPIDLDFCFEMLAHVTSFFGKKVILLGLFKGQNLENKYDLLVRVTPGKEYVKVVMKDGRMQGAVLIGDTGLEETFENLILNQMDLSVYGEDLLSPDVDIEDYFD